MAHEALYRVTRPQTFGALIGQEVIARTLRRAVAEDKTSHAYLFAGPRGTGKTSAAKIFAKAVNCLHPQDGEPCNMCENCLAIRQERLPDVLEIDAASNRGIDEIRELKERVRFAPSIGKKKVYIIDEVHMLTTEAFNALLKTLEEPPDDVIFILATTDPEKIPATVLSRTQRFDFKRIQENHIATHLSHIAGEQGITITEDAVQLIARKARGGMRDAVSLLDQAIAFAEGSITRDDVLSLLGGIDELTLADWLDSLAKEDAEQAYTIAQTLLQQAGDPKRVLEAFSDWLRSVTLASVHIIEDIPKDLEARLKANAEQIPRTHLRAYRHIVQKSLEHMRYASDSDVVYGLCLLDLLETKTALSSTPATKVSTPQKEQPSIQSQSRTPQKKRDEKNSTSTTQVEQPQASDASDLLANWSEVMQALKAESVRLHAFLLPATPNIKDGILYLLFNDHSEFHYQQISRPENLQVVQRIVEQKAGHPITCKTQLQSAKEERPTTPSNDPLFDEAREMFGDAFVLDDSSPFSV